EVQEFLHTSLGADGLKRCVMVVSTSDEAPLLRVRAAKVATTIAEYFRDRGMHVMLMMDSLTRMCQAQRQIGLAAKEPPATKGFPPSVFALIPEILERAGKTATGSITGFYTVLVEGDDFNEPIPDAVKGISDGHLWLSRTLANRGHFPAIDVLQSISRVRGDVTDKPPQAAARPVPARAALSHDLAAPINPARSGPGPNAAAHGRAARAHRREAARRPRHEGHPPARPHRRRLPRRPPAVCGRHAAQGLVARAGHGPPAAQGRRGPGACRRSGEGAQGD